MGKKKQSDGTAVLIDYLENHALTVYAYYAWGKAFNMSRYFFNNDKKAFAWMITKNPNLGQVSPDHMIRSGRGKRLLKWMDNQLNENKRTI